MSCPEPRSCRQQQSLICGLAGGQNALMRLIVRGASLLFWAAHLLQWQENTSGGKVRFFSKQTYCSSPGLTHCRCAGDCAIVTALSMHRHARGVPSPVTQAGSLWPEPNKVFLPVPRLWGRFCVSPPRGQCHADLKLIQLSADSTRLGQIKQPQPLSPASGSALCSSV